MGLPLLSARIILVVVFGVAGAAKLTSLKAVRKAVADFGLPDWLANPLGSVLPFAELTIAISLLPARSAWWGAWGALVLLGAFITAIAVNLVQGHKPDCQCFGQIHSKPIGWSTLVRNGVLAGFAGFVVLAGAAVQPSFIGLAVLSGTQAPASAITIFAFALAVETWLIFHLFKQHGRLLLRMDELEKRLGDGRMQAEPALPQGLPLGAPAPAFELPTLARQPLELDGLLDSKPAILIFADPDCGPCTELLPEIARWQQDYAHKMRIAVVSRGTERANRAKTKKHGVQDVLLQKDREIAELYQVNGAPAAVLIRADGAIGSRVVGGSETIRSLVMTAAGVRAWEKSVDFETVPSANPMASRSGLAIGNLAPPFALPDLRDRMVSLSEFRGNKTLVLFWNPECGFCQRMLPALQTWEENRTAGAPVLIMVSTGSVDANEEMGLRSQVLLDEDMSVARKFRGGGTPSAVLVDAEGKIASELGVGIPGVLALLGITSPKATAPAVKTQWPVKLSASRPIQGQLRA